MRILEAEEVTQEKVAEILKNAAFNISLEDSEIYINDTNFPLSLRINHEKQFIMLYTFIPFLDDLPIEKLNEFSSDCNAEYELVQFSNTRNTDGKNYMYGFYYMFFNFGIIPQQLIFTIREFTSSYLTALREKDKDDLYFG